MGLFDFTKPKNKKEKKAADSPAKIKAKKEEKNGKQNFDYITGKY